MLGAHKNGGPRAAVSDRIARQCSRCDERAGFGRPRTAI